MTVSISLKESYVDVRDYILDSTASASTFNTYWQAAVTAAEGKTLVVPGGYTYKMDISNTGAAATLPSQTHILGLGWPEIYVYDGDHLGSAGYNPNGFTVNGSSSPKENITITGLYFIGENDPYSEAANWASKCIYLYATEDTGFSNNFNFSGNRFDYLHGFPMQCIVGNRSGAEPKDDGAFGRFDENFLYYCRQGLNISVPFASVSRNVLWGGEGLECARLGMRLNDNIFYFTTIAVSLGGDITVGEHTHGMQALRNVSFGNRGVAAFQFAESAWGAEMSHNTAILPDGLGFYCSGASFGGANDPHHSVISYNKVVNAGLLSGTPGSVTRTAYQINRDYVKFHHNISYNDPLYTSTHESQYGVIWQGNHGDLIGNETVGTTWDIQFDGTATNDQCTDNYVDISNLWNPTRVSFLRAPTGASYFRDGSQMRANRPGGGGFVLPTPSINYAGLTLTVNDDRSGYGDRLKKCVKAPSGNYVWTTLDGWRHVAKVGSYNATLADSHVVVLMTTGASDRSVNLPAVATSEGMEIEMVKVDAGVGKAVFDGDSGDTINGATTLDLASQWDRARIYCDGSQWVMTEGNV